LGKQLGSQSFIEHLGEDNFKYLVNFILRYLSELDIPIKRYVTFDEEAEVFDFGM
jgi:phosphomannomutase